jgi:hypothetical protein
MQRFGRWFVGILVALLAVAQVADFVVAPRTLASVVKARIGASTLEKELRVTYKKGGIGAVIRLCEGNNLRESNGFYTSCSVTRGRSYGQPIYGGHNSRTVSSIYQVWVEAYDREELFEMSRPEGRAMNAELRPVYSGGYEGVKTVGIIQLRDYVRPYYTRVVLDISYPSSS